MISIGAVLGRMLGFVCLVFCAQAWAGPPVLAVQPGDGHLSLMPRAEQFEDPSRNMTLAQVRSDEARWKPTAAGDTKSFGFSRSAWWLRVRLENTSHDSAQTRILELASALQDYMDLYLVRPSGEILASYQTGDRRPFAQRGLDYRNPAFPLTLEAGEPLDVYLRLDTYDGLFEAMGLDLWNERDFIAKAGSDTLFFGLYYGLLLALLIYNLLLFITTRNRAFGLYVAYVASFFLLNVTFCGFALQYWWPRQPDLDNQMLALSAVVTFFAFMLFVGEYVQLKAYSPRRVYPLHRFLTACSLLCGIPALLGYYALTFMIAFPLWMVAMGYCLVNGTMMALGQTAPGTRAARYALLAFTLLAVGVGLHVLDDVGVLPSNALTRNMLQIGSAAEVLLLAFGLADQMNALKAQKLAAERSAREAQAALAGRLDEQVRQRTRELEQANQQLARTAITDELTGAYNRRHFNEIFAAEIRRPRRGKQLAFCIFDVDRFKSYNDRYGHQKGDEVLQAVAVSLRSRLRRSGDKLFRLGGEEFGIVIGVDDAQQASQFVDVLRSEIEDLKIPHEDAPQGIVTASFGLLVVAATDQNPRPKDIYAAADALLYQAKSAGRNRVQCGIA